MSKKQKRILIRIIISVILYIVGVILPVDGYLKMILLLIPYAVIGYDVVYSAIRTTLKGQLFDEKFLMSIATVGALVLGEYKEAVAVMLFYQIGELFQKVAVSNSRKSISSLMDICPEYAVVLRDGEECKVSPEEVLESEIIIVRPGEKIPIDGVIVEGSTTLNASALTGESIPVLKGINDSVISGSINMTSVIKVKTMSTYENSTVSKILELVENSSEKKAKSEKFITRFARVYTPFIVISALCLAIIPPLFFRQSFNSWLMRALIFLVVSCPCALVVSIPLSFFGSIGGASKQGILIKGANYLETLSKVDTVVFDKTGTLTKGNFVVFAIHSDVMTKDKLLDIAATAESYSNHPIAQSIILAHNKAIDKSRIGNIEEISGLGLKAVIDNETYYIGNEKLMDRINCKWHKCHLDGTAIHISKNSEYMGHIIIVDELKDNAKLAIENLKKCGINKTVMLTGDSESVAKSVGKQLDIKDIYSSLLPKDKVDEIENLILSGNRVCFVGDGINDAPVLKRADVGIAMGALGSDAAIESADIVLMDDNLNKLSAAIKLSKKTMKIVKQNIYFSLFVKAIILLFSALGMTNMWIAIFGDVGVMILAILNSMRTLR